MHYAAILFDLDGTLLPMDTEKFVRAYFKALSQELAPFGVAPDRLIQAVLGGTRAMMHNDGSCLNADAFWTVFTTVTGVARETVEPICDRFYSKGFHSARAATWDNPQAAEAVRLARTKADKVILATNPLFPMQAQTTRLSWLGLSPADFDLVTCYSSDRYCKPNPAYYREICRRFDLEAAKCLMIGNDDREDMAAAASLGMHTWLVTDCRIMQEDAPWQGPQGSFAQTISMLRSL